MHADSHEVVCKALTFQTFRSNMNYFFFFPALPPPLFFFPVKMVQ